jgi:hypothetical protein
MPNAELAPDATNPTPEPAAPAPKRQGRALGWTFRDLRRDAEHAAFTEQFCAQLERRSKGDIRIAIAGERIAGCKRVIGVFAGDEMVAGYIIHDGPELLLLKVVPEDIRDAWTRDHALSDTCELNLIWRNAGISDVAFALVVWPRIILDCVRNGRKYILGSGYDNPLKQRYTSVDPEMVYAGPSLTTGVQVYIYAYTRPKIVATFFVSFAEKFFRRRKKA